MPCQPLGFKHVFHPPCGRAPCWLQTALKSSRHSFQIVASPLKSVGSHISACDISIPTTDPTGLYQNGCLSLVRTYGRIASKNLSLLVRRGRRLPAWQRLLRARTPARGHQLLDVFSRLLQNLQINKVVAVKQLFGHSQLAAARPGSRPIPGRALRRESALGRSATQTRNAIAARRGCVGKQTGRGFCQAAPECVEPLVESVNMPDKRRFPATAVSTAQ